MYTNRARSPEKRCCVLLVRTAMARAFRWPTTTTSFLHRVISVKTRLRGWSN